MTDFTLLDYIYFAVVFGSTIWAFARGGVFEMVATFSWLVAAVTSRFISPELNILLQRIFGLDEPTIGTLISSYFIVFFGVLVIFGLFNQRLRDWIQDSILHITDRTLGIIFGMIRAVVLMGLVYWAMLWYYEDVQKPTFLTAARTRPVMQLTAVKLHEWFVPGPAPLLERDMSSTSEADELFFNLIDPAIRRAAERQFDGDNNEWVGYSETERQMLENQLLQFGHTPDFEPDEFVMPDFGDYIEYKSTWQ